MNRPLPRSQAYKKRGSNALPCPECGGNSVVLDSRGHELGLRRRRGCIGCGVRFTTFETYAEVEPALAASYKKKLRATKERLATALAAADEILDEE